jgi:hypothetical protein
MTTHFKAGILPPKTSFKKQKRVALVDKTRKIKFHRNVGAGIIL